MTGVLRRLVRNPAGLLGLIITCAVFAMFLASFVWVPYGPQDVNPADSWARPSARHLLGADKLGRDVFSLLVLGSRVTVATSAGAVVIAVTLGLLIAGVIAFAPRWCASLTERLTDVAIAFPTLIIALILATAFSGSALGSIVAIGLSSATSVTRTILPELRRAAASDHVLLATAAGARPGWLLTRHIVPALTPTLLVRATQVMGVAALAEAGLSYLGLGTAPPTPSWGRMLSAFQTQVYERPGALAVPAIAIVLVILGFNLLGDGLRDVLDPRSEHSR